MEVATPPSPTRKVARLSKLLPGTNAASIEVLHQDASNASGDNVEEKESRGTSCLGNITLNLPLLPGVSSTSASSPQNLLTTTTTTSSTTTGRSLPVILTVGELKFENERSPSSSPPTKSRMLLRQSAMDEDENTSSEEGEELALKGRGAEEEEEEEEPSSCLICMNEFSPDKPALRLPCRNKCNENFVHGDCLYEWKVRQASTGARGAAPENGTCPLCRTELDPFNFIPKDAFQSASLFMFGARRNFCLHPLPIEGGIARCYLRILKTSMTTKYEFYLQTPSIVAYPHGPLPSSEPVQGDRLLMVAETRSMSVFQRQRVKILIAATDNDAVHNRYPYYAATLESEISGLGHRLYGNSLSGKRMEEIAGILYSQNRYGAGYGPRVVSIAIPALTTPGAMAEANKIPSRPSTPETTSTSTRRGSLSSTSSSSSSASSSSTIPHPLQTSSSLRALKKMRVAEPGANSSAAQVTMPSAGSAGSMSSRNLTSVSAEEGNNNQTEQQQSDALFMGTNIKPRWNEDRECYSLDFRGRVRFASNKNFQLAFDGLPKLGVGVNGNSATFQFGKVLEFPTKVYTCDFQWPLSPVQAFGICLAACVPKLAVA